MSDEIHDFSRVDKFMAARRRSLLLHAAWRPMLAGAIGAAIIVGAVWIASPRLRFNEIEIPRITLKDVEIQRVVQRDKPFDVYIPHAVPFDNYVPTPAAAPVAAGGQDQPSGPAASSSQPAATPMPVAPAASNPSPAAPKTPAEQKFTQKPEYKTAPFKGRIVKSTDGRALSFDDGRNFWPAHFDNNIQKLMDDLGDMVDSENFVGDFGMCAPEGHAELWRCIASHNGVETEILNKSIQPPKPFAQKAATADQPPPPRPSPSPSPPAVVSDNGMIFVKVDLGKGVSVNAMVDSGASWGMAIPSALADTLVAKNLAVRRPKPKNKTTFADGTTHEVGAISIKRIIVDGRVLENVETAVVPNRGAPVLLGLGALNRLGAFTIENGKLIFASQRPT